MLKIADCLQHWQMERKWERMKERKPFFCCSSMLCLAWWWWRERNEPTRTELRPWPWKSPGDFHAAKEEEEEEAPKKRSCYGANESMRHVLFILLSFSSSFSFSIPFKRKYSAFFFSDLFFFLKIEAFFSSSVPSTAEKRPWAPTGGRCGLVLVLRITKHVEKRGLFSLSRAFSSFLSFFFSLFFVVPSKKENNFCERWKEKEKDGTSRTDGKRKLPWKKGASFFPLYFMLRYRMTLWDWVHDGTHPGKKKWGSLFTKKTGPRLWWAERRRSGPFFPWKYFLAFFSYKIPSIHVFLSFFLLLTIITRLVEPVSWCLPGSFLPSFFLSLYLSFVVFVPSFGSLFHVHWGVIRKEEEKESEWLSLDKVDRKEEQTNSTFFKVSLGSWGNGIMHVALTGEGKTDKTFVAASKKASVRRVVVVSITWHFGM